MKRTRISHILDSGETGSKTTVMGWVRTRRDSKGGFSFIELNDGSCLSGLQVIADITDIQVSVGRSMIETLAYRDVEDQVRLACDVAGVIFRARARL